MDLILITTTSDDRAELERIASRLVELKLAACCQIGGPITSVYTWEGKTDSSQEYVCSIKTRKRLFEDVANEIKALHHYEIPQIVSVEISNASDSYRDWVIRMSSDLP